MVKFLGSISWKYKVAMIAAAPLFVATVLSLVIVSIMFKQNNAMEPAIEQTNI